MKKSSKNLWLPTLLLSLAIYIVFNIIGRWIPGQIDLTEKKIHSLSSATHQKIQSLKTPVTIRYYLSKKDNSIPYDLRSYSERVDFYLDNLAKINPDKIKVVKLDPLPGSDAESMAKFDTITNNYGENKEQFYFGLAVNCGNKKFPIPFMHPDRKDLLEYDILRSIETVSTEEYQTIGIISSLPVAGGQYSNERGQGEFPAWLFIQELRKIYTVTPYDEKPEQLLKSPPAVLILMHPIGLADATLKAVDQYIANGGKVIVLVDPFSAAITMINPNMVTQASTSDAPEFFKAWGIRYQPQEVVADMVHRSEINRGYGPETLHTAINILQRYIKKDDEITAGINIAGFVYTGHVLPSTEEISRRFIPLVTTSDNISTVKASEIAALDRAKNEQLLKEFKSDGMRRAVAAKMMGPLPKLYADTKDGKKIADTECQLIVFADTDFIFDPFAGETVQLSKNQTTVKPLNGNLALFANAIDYLAGNEMLSSARTKGSAKYPLSGLADARASIDSTFESQRNELNNTISAKEQALESLISQDKSEKLNEVVLQQNQIKELKGAIQLNKDKLAEIDQTVTRKVQEIQNKHHGFNTYVIPLIIFLIGFVTVAMRSYKSRAL